ncbi:hypothetical protein AB0L61_19030 [Streptomyces tendae]|uniref:hypothetical protein n=1 Tax=Streptomyces tendae TaxID=1932 RepID=UPI00342DB127
MTAHVITDGAVAVTVASALADEFRAGSSVRDAERRPLREELHRLFVLAPTNVP